MRQFDSSTDNSHARTKTSNFRHIPKAFFATGIAGIVLFTSACGAEVNEAVPNPDSTSVASVEATINAATPAAMESSDSTVAGSVVNGIPTKKELAKNVKGQYIQTTLADNDPSLSYNQAIVDETAFKYTPEEITAVQKQIMTFIAEETIDSPLKDSFDAQDVDVWWAKNKDKFLEKHHAEFYESLTTQDMYRMIVFKSEFRKDKYDLAYGKDTTHVSARTITPTQIVGGELFGLEAIQFIANVDFNLVANVDGPIKDENTTGVVNYTLVKQDGKWLISGFTNTFNSFPLQ